MDEQTMASTSRSINHWPHAKCARAFWDQGKLPPYQELLADTTAWLEPSAGQHWLDLGCGCGSLTKALWTRSRGQVAEVIGVDVAAINGTAYENLRQTLQPRPSKDALGFVAADFSGGLGLWGEGRFDGVVSGLSISYAEAYDEITGRWTCEAYDRILAEVLRVVRPGGTFVFSVNVPEPNWAKVALRSLASMFEFRRPLKSLKKAWRLWRYGGWLKREARLGRFHYFPLETIVAKLAAAGWQDIEHRLSYVGQAYLIRCRKPLRTQVA
jgi:SAM-dependent methyltransferase